MQGLDSRKLIYQYPSMRGRPRQLPVAATHIVLALLPAELHGYALMREVEELSGGAVRLGPGTLYGTINRLLDDGLIEETTNRIARDDGDRRRYYQLTTNGRTVAVGELERLQSLVRHVRAQLPRGATT
jgi:DNA-binding PadR family transcriptional regulator